MLFLLRVKAQQKPNKQRIKSFSILLMLGCEQGQGYGIARPMPADKVLAWVLAWQSISCYSSSPSNPNLMNCT